MAIQSSKQTVVDNRFFTPPGIVDVRSAGEADGSLAYVNTGDIASDDTAPILSDPNAVVPIPTSFTVADQRVRIASDGSAVVDVTLEFPDIDGIDSIDVRVSKV